MPGLAYVSSLVLTTQTRIIIVTAVDQRLPADRTDPASAPPAAATRAPLRVRSEEHLKGGAEIVIDHRGREYRLRVTQNGKLILTA